MITLSEVKPSIAKRAGGWTPTAVHTCLEGKEELSKEGLEEWLEADVCLIPLLGASD